MANGELSGNDAFKMVITPGEKIQNWLSQYGVCGRVEDRNYTNPEPPAGLWSLLNGAVAIACLGAFIALIAFVVFNVVPTLARVLPL